MLAAPSLPRQPPGPPATTLRHRWLLPSVCQPSRQVGCCVASCLHSFIPPLPETQKPKSSGFYSYSLPLPRGVTLSTKHRREGCRQVPPSECLHQALKERGKG